MWSVEFGYVSLHDPTMGEWWDVKVNDAPGWAVGEARRRKDLYKGGNRKAYRLTVGRWKRFGKLTKHLRNALLRNTP